MISLVLRMLALHKQLPKASTPHENTALLRRIEATDGQIDALVYERYALTEEETGIVEAGSQVEAFGKVFSTMSPCLSQAIEMKAKL